MTELSRVDSGAARSHTQRIGWLVTSRLEKYRKDTEAWLEKNGVEYDHLMMLDLPDRETAVRTFAHANHKAEVYRKCGATLFVESDLRQSEVIAEAAGKPVLCVETQHVVEPPRGATITMQQNLKLLPRRIRLRKSPATSLQALALKVRGVIGQERGPTLPFSEQLKCSISCFREQRGKRLCRRVRADDLGYPVSSCSLQKALRDRTLELSENPSRPNRSPSDWQPATSSEISSFFSAAQIF